MQRTATMWWLLNSLIGLALLLAVSPWAFAMDGERERELIRLVRQDCGSCHGMTLKGGLGRPLLPDALQHADQAALASIILDGVPGKPMPGWRGLLSAEEANWIAANLKRGFPQ